MNTIETNIWTEITPEEALDMFNLGGDGDGYEEDGDIFTGSIVMYIQQYTEAYETDNGNILFLENN